MINICGFVFILNMEVQNVLLCTISVIKLFTLLFLGLQQCVDCLKSLSLALALVECEIEVPRAVYLSRLEQAYQIIQWGTVEWYHDIDVMELQARVAAATLFVHFCHDFSSTQTKQKSTLSSLTT